MLTVITRTKTTAKIELTRDEIDTILIAEIKKRYGLTEEVCKTYDFSVGWDCGEATVVIYKEETQTSNAL